MKKIPIVISFIFYIAIVSYSQKVHEFQLYFETNNAELNPGHKNKIDSVLLLLANTPQAYKVEITGHTDNVGSANFNQALSLKRAVQTGYYFKEKKFRAAKIITSGKSFNEPISENETEKGKLKNRRVNILISVNIPDRISIGGVRTKPDYYKVNVESGSVIEHSSGTTILIPTDAFVDKNGNEVKGDIQVVYQEYRNPVDFIFSGIPMSFIKDGKVNYFNSAGMFKIDANKDGVPLFLKDGESIRVNFKMTENLPDLNFYNYNEDSKTWTELINVTDGSSKSLNVFRNQFSPCGFTGRGERSCRINECDVPEFLNRMVDTFAYGNKSILEEYFATSPDGIKKQVKENDSIINLDKEKIDSLNEIEKSFFRNYSVIKVSESKSKLFFTISSTATAYNEFADFKKIQWIYNLKTETGLKSTIYKRKWTNCQIKSKNDSFTISLKDSTELLELENVQLFITDKSARKDPNYIGSLFEKYNVAVESYTKTLSEVISKRDKLKSEIEMMAEMNNTLRFVEQDKIQVKNDSLFCFWYNSKTYMTQTEKVMNIEEWFYYFDKHKSEMITRYKTILPTVKDYCQKKREQEKLLSENFDKVSEVKAGSDETAGGIFKSMNVSALGIYNYDQIFKLKDKITLFGKYIGKNGKIIIPLIIYIIDKNLKGVIKFDGSGGFGPLKFDISKNAKPTLLAIDLDGNSYIYNSEKFKIPTSDFIEYTFELEKIDKLEKPEDLEKLF